MRNILLYEGELVILVGVVGLYSEEAFLLTDDNTVIFEEEKDVEGGKVILFTSIDSFEGIEHHKIGDPN